MEQIVAIAIEGGNHMKRTLSRSPSPDRRVKSKSINVTLSSPSSKKKPASATSESQPEKRGRQVSLSTSSNVKKLKKASVSDEESSGSSDEPIILSARSNVKKPKKASVSDEESSASSDEPIMLSAPSNVKKQKKAPVSDEESARSSDEPFVSPAPVIHPIQNTTTEVLKSQWKAARFMIIQFGGQTGSTAGDAALYAANGRTDTSTFVDVGPLGVQNNRLIAAEKILLAGDGKSDTILDEAESSDDEWENKLKEIPPGDNRLFGVITHSHKDHAQGNLPVKPVDLTGLRIGTSGSGTWQASTVPQTTTKQVAANGERVYSFRESGKANGKTKSKAQMRMTGRAILPKPTAKPTDINAKSLGIVTKIERGGASNGERLFTMYSLGDMTPNAGAEAVKEMFDKDGQPINIVKVAHHGSDDNIAALPPEITNENMIVLFSGFTGKGGENDRSDLSRFLARKALHEPKADRGKSPEELDAKPKYKWKEGYILYADQRHADEIRGTALGKKLIAAGFKFAQDYVIQVTPEGKVEHFPTTWAK